MDFFDNIRFHVCGYEVDIPAILWQNSGKIVAKYRQYRGEKRAKGKTAKGGSL